MKTALVTGSAVRLGRALVERLASAGYAVWVHHWRSEDEAKRVAHGIVEAGGVAHVVGGDIGSPEAVEHIVNEIRRVSGRLDLLVNNVGQYPTGNLLRMEPEHFKRTLDVNLVGAYHLIHDSLPLFPESGGHIVNIGYTGLGALASSPTNTAYVISKTGLLLLTRSYAELLGPRGIRVNMVSPGQLDNSVDLPENFADSVPLGRAGRVDDIIETIMFLISDRADYITGQNIEVAGGYMLRVADCRI
jgi:3-oxoacyl-[acyl-carrier protein] reductase